jgi:hypothetical protein
MIALLDTQDEVQAMTLELLDIWTFAVLSERASMQ